MSKPKSPSLVLTVEHTLSREDIAKVIAVRSFYRYDDASRLPGWTKSREKAERFLRKWMLDHGAKSSDDYFENFTRARDRDAQLRHARLVTDWLFPELAPPAADETEADAA